MNIGGKVIPLVPLKDKQGNELNLDYYTILAINPVGEGAYRIKLAETDDIEYNEHLFEELPMDFLSPREKILHDLSHWRSELIKFENRDDEEQIRKIHEILDFYLDKLLVQLKSDKDAIEGYKKYRSENGTTK